MSMSSQERRARELIEAVERSEHNAPDLIRNKVELSEDDGRAERRRQAMLRCVRHVYVSTACDHARWVEAGAPEVAGHTAAELHAECRTEGKRWDGTDKKPASCKWCGAPCECPCHTEAIDV